MLNSLAGIHRTSKESLVLFINETNNTTIDHEMVFFSKPRPVEDTYRAGTTDKNTIVRITAKEGYEDFRGSAVVVYDRLNLADLNHLISFEVETHQPETTHDLIIPIWRRFGIIFDPEDIVDEPLVNISEVPENSMVVSFKAAVDSLRWLGECNITLVDGRVEFRDFLSETVLPGMNYPVEGDGTSGSAIVYMYSLDFTPVKDVIETFPEEYVVDEFSTDLLAAVRETDINIGWDKWNLDPANPEWSLHGAEVFYNGINDESLPTNKSYKYVMGLRLRADVTVPPGVMYLHYNDPFDPTKLEQ